MNRLMMCPNPFSSDRIEATAPEGSTVAEMIRSAGMNPDPIFARVFIDDRLVEKAQWEHAVPRAGQLVTVRVIPQGGGQGGGKDVLRLVGMIAVMAVAIYVTSGGAAGLLGQGFGAGTFGAGLAGLGTSVIGSLAMNERMPRRGLLT